MPGGTNSNFRAWGEDTIYIDRGKGGRVWDIDAVAKNTSTSFYGNIVSLAINRSLLPALPYDVERDLTLVSNVTFVFNMLAVNNSLPVRNVAELIAYAKANPGKVTFGSAGNGSSNHLSGEVLKSIWR